MGVVILGSINMDVVLRVPNIALPGETLSASAKNLYSGGKGANQAIAAARMGAKTTLMGAVGDDEFGTSLKSALSGEGIDISGLQTLADTDTGQAYICVSDEGENAIIVVPGANHDFRFASTREPGPDSGSVYLSQFEMPLDQIKAFMGAAKGSLRIVNAAPALKTYQPLLDDVEIVIVNETELAVFSDENINETSSASGIEGAARKLLKRDDQWVIVTLGKKGAIAASRNQTLSIPGYEIEAVDTTGAGDCFCGTLAATLSEGMDMQLALTHANAAAALAVTKSGAGPSMPERQQVAKLVDETKT